jgi:hypothetical protein
MDMKTAWLLPVKSGTQGFAASLTVRICTNQHQPLQVSSIPLAPIMCSTHSLADVLKQKTLSNCTPLHRTAQSINFAELLCLLVILLNQQCWMQLWYNDPLQSGRLQQLKKSSQLMNY